MNLSKIRIDGIPVILWGIGNYYSAYKEYIKYCIPIDYVHDMKWENSAVTEFGGYPVISLKEMCNIGKCAIIICLWGSGNTEEDICNEISENIPDALTYRLRDIIPINRRLEKEEIVDGFAEGIYKDFYGNCIECGTPVSLERVNIQFNGSNARIKIGSEVWVANELNIECGNNATVTIGNGTTFDKTTLYSAYGDIRIGADCMFSYEVFLRNHDSHFIFDAETGNRINYTKTIEVKDHVWIGQNAILLAGFTVGKNSIVGAGSISSSAFPDGCVIAGNPARIIREGVTWHRDMTWTENYSNINDTK